MILLVMLPFAVLLVCGVVLIVLSRRRGPSFPSCGQCGYDLSGTIGSAARCPECGVDFAEAGIVPSGGPRRTGMFVTGIVMSMIAIGCMGTGAVSSVISYKRAQAARQQAIMQMQRAMQLQLQAVEQAQVAAEEARLAAELAAEAQRAEMRETLADGLPGEPGPRRPEPPAPDGR